MACRPALDHLVDRTGDVRAFGAGIDEYRAPLAEQQVEKRFFEVAAPPTAAE
jgi:hypothetical protein